MKFYQIFAENARPIEGKKPYTVLQLAGRAVYIKDSCNACHSQLIRPFKSETDRYGMYSVSGELLMIDLFFGAQKEQDLILLV